MMYGSDKYIHSEHSTLNNRVLKYNPDGTFTIRYGPKGGNTDNFPNYLETPGDNWYLGVRVYRAEAPVIDGKYDLPVPKLVK